LDAEGSTTVVELGEESRTVRLTQVEALANVVAVLPLCGAGKLRCSEKTRRPAAATVAAVAAVLTGGDIYAAEPIAAFAWPFARMRRDSHSPTVARNERSCGGCKQAMSWYDEHLYAFESDEATLVDPRSDSDEIPADGERLVSIATQRGDQFTYLYDFGDGWTHTVTLDEIQPGGPDNVFRILDGGGACAPEDIGGVARSPRLMSWTYRTGMAVAASGGGAGRTKHQKYECSKRYGWSSSERFISGIT
jgi:hypothetical protein